MDFTFQNSESPISSASSKEHTRENPDTRDQQTLIRGKQQQLPQQQPQQQLPQQQLSKQQPPRQQISGVEKVKVRILELSRGQQNIAI